MSNAYIATGPCGRLGDGIDLMLRDELVDLRQAPMVEQISREHRAPMQDATDPGKRPGDEVPFSDETEQVEMGETRADVARAAGADLRPDRGLRPRTTALLVVCSDEWALAAAGSAARGDPRATSPTATSRRRSAKAAAIETIGPSSGVKINGPFSSVSTTRQGANEEDDMGSGADARPPDPLRQPISPRCPSCARTAAGTAICSGGGQGDLRRAYPYVAPQAVSSTTGSLYDDEHASESSACVVGRLRAGEEQPCAGGEGDQPHALP